MTNGFRYKVLQTGQGPEVEVSNFRWKTSVYSAMWSAAWAFATTFLFSSLGRYGAFAFFGGVFCGLMALLGTRVLILSLVKRQLSQSATELAFNRRSWASLSRGDFVWTRSSASALAIHLTAGLVS